MQPMKVATEAFQTLWRHKVLWLFGFFVAAGGGSGASNHTGNASGGGMAPLPSWAFAAIALGGVLGLLVLLAHVVSEGALISAARDARQGTPVRAGAELKAGWRFVGRVFVIKLLITAAVGGTLLIAAVPALLGAFRLVPLWLGICATLPLALAAVPWTLTLYLGYVYALRIAVLDGRSAWEAVRDARQFLHGRVLDSLKLLVVTFLGQLAAAPLLVVGLIPGALAGLGVYAAAGIVPALAVGLPIVFLLTLPVVGASGAFGSLVWTLGFLDGRAEQGG